MNNIFYGLKFSAAAALLATVTTQDTFNDVRFKWCPKVKKDRSKAKAARQARKKNRK